MNKYKLSIAIEKDDDGYFSFCPELDGCFTQGESYGEVVENMKDAVRLHVEDRVAEGEIIPQNSNISLVMMEVDVEV